MASAAEQVNELIDKAKKANLPKELQERVLKRLEQLVALVESPTFLPEFDSMSRYLDWILSLPWDKRTKDILDLEFAKKTLDKNHYGLEDLKARVVEYISVMKLKQDKGVAKEEVMRAPILCFVGLVGTGKTTIASSIADAMGRKFARIPFGGMGDPLDLRGKSRMHSESEPGKIIKALRSTQSKNCVILLDEIDRVTEQGRSSIMGVLVELLDPKQNFQYVDHYIDYPVDLSEVLFIATANNTHTISTAVLDRLEPISMPSYTDQEKITIGKEYMLPRIMKEAGIREGGLEIDEQVWAQVVRPLGFDAGMRTLERTINQVARKVARLMVEGKEDSVRITSENLKQFIS
jgi:ATP-dependent Lon protease